jgi:hypothetical protein
MADKRPKDWRSIPGGRPLNDARGITLERIMDAEERLDARRERLRLREDVIVEVLDALEPETDEPVEDLYLRTVASYVVALGGHIEVRAIFPDEQVLLLRDPKPGE